MFPSTVSSAVIPVKENRLHSGVVAWIGVEKIVRPGQKWEIPSGLALRFMECSVIVMPAKFVCATVQHKLNVAKAVTTFISSIAEELELVGSFSSSVMKTCDEPEK